MASIADELEKLHNLFLAGTLTEPEFLKTKADLLQADNSLYAATDQPLAEELARLRLQTELLRIDSEWQAERERHYVRSSDNCSREVPSASGVAMSVVAAVIGCAFGIFWINGAQSAGAPPFFAAAGAVFILVCICNPLYYGAKFAAYDQAHSSYQQRRAKASRKLAKLDEQPASASAFPPSK